MGGMSSANPVPRDDAPQVPGPFGVDEDPYTDDDSEGAGDDDEGGR